MTARGIWTVAKLELMQRVRGGRWYIALGVWVLVIAGVTALTYWALNTDSANAGSALYDVIVFFVLGLGMLVMPSLTATSVNGDREHGVLATLQTTLLTSWDIVLGKLLAAWLVSLAFLAAALPFLLLAFIEGGIGAGVVLRSLLILVLVLAVVCAVGLMFSTLTARTVSSAVLTYLTIAALTVGTVIVFAMSYFLVADQEDVRIHGIPDSEWSKHMEDAPTEDDCTIFTRQMEVGHTERIWWLLAANPFVVVADAAPRQPGTWVDNSGSFTPLQAISTGIRAAKAGPSDAPLEECHFETGTPEPGGYTSPEVARAESAGAVWPYGLTFLLGAGLVSVLVAHRRLRTPIRRLPNGTRIA
ncbi:MULTISPECIES: ABC transporter permease [unclassified Janibacter]|uniref:ABC transporter permease n=1 Tax=unclassified Janibacter TaxID=2649294 RepID=UPI003D0530C9